MTKRRLEQLLEKDLNGELSAIEREELVRLLWTDPQARKEREAWRRFEQRLGEAMRATPRLDLLRSGAKVMGLRGERGPSRAKWYGLSRLIWIGAPVVIIASWFASREEAPAPSVIERVDAARQVPAVPVQIRFEDPGTMDDRDSRPVTIQF